MNELMHEAINKFHTVNIMCGSLALEVESDNPHVKDTAYLKQRILQLISNAEDELRRARQLLIEITSMMAEKLNCYHENEHFLKTIESAMSFSENKAIELKNIIEKDNPLSLAAVSALLHSIEEKNLSCAVGLKDIKDKLIKSGKYKPKH
jgi:hypothetical protein